MVSRLTFSSANLRRGHFPWRSRDLNSRALPPAPALLDDPLPGQVVAVVGDGHPAALVFPVGGRRFADIVIESGEQQAQLFLLAEASDPAYGLGLVDRQPGVMPDAVMAEIILLRGEKGVLGGQGEAEALREELLEDAQ